MQSMKQPIAIPMHVPLAIPAAMLLKSGCPSAKPMLMPISIPKIIQLPLSSVFFFLIDMFFSFTLSVAGSF